MLKNKNAIDRFTSRIFFIVSFSIATFFYLGTASAIEVRSGKAESLTIICPDIVMAGKPFQVEIITKDRFGNIVTDFNNAPKRVEVRAIGAGKISPDTIPVGCFVNGAATVDFTYNKEENFTIFIIAISLDDAEPNVIAEKTIKAISGEKKTASLLEGNSKSDAEGSCRDLVIELQSKLIKVVEENSSLKKDLSKLKVSLKEKDQAVLNLEKILTDKTSLLKKSEEEALLQKTKIKDIELANQGLQKNVSQVLEDNSFLKSEIDSSKQELSKSLAMLKQKDAQKLEFKPTIKDIQTALKNAGFDPGSLDDKMGPRTRQAIKDFQKSKGLVPDGAVGLKTWAILDNLS